MIVIWFGEFAQNKNKNPLTYNEHHIYVKGQTQQQPSVE